MDRVICLLIGYGFGMIQTAYFYGMTKGVDIRTKGSGNAGTTNVLRTFGPKAGFLTLGCDVLKCMAAILVTWLIFRHRAPELVPLYKICTAAGVILGHDFPFYLQFRGGKGIACTVGMILSFGDLRMALISLGTFLVLFLATHYVSLCSMCMASVFSLGVILSAVCGVYGLPRGAVAELCVLLLILMGLAIYGHRTNIGRLVSGTERKTYLGGRPSGK